MGLDERAFGAAWDAFVASYGKDRDIQLRDSITAYEQARERVAFEVTWEEWEEYINSEDRPGYPLATLNRILAQRPAPSAQPWTRAVTLDSIARIIAQYPDDWAWPGNVSQNYLDLYRRLATRIVEHMSHRVLPPEPSKPATPDLDLAGRVEGLEKFARHVLEAFGKLTTEHGDSVATVFGDASLADALKALEGK